MSAAEFVPASADLEGLRRASLDCKGCHLYERATQTVFSRGAVTSRVVLVGEQPGDVEDRRGGAFFWGASSRGWLKRGGGSLLWGPPASCLTALWPRRGSIPPRRTRRMRSSTSSSPRAAVASGASTRPRTPTRSAPADRGWSPS